MDARSTAGSFEKRSRLARFFGLKPKPSSSSLRYNEDDGNPYATTRASGPLRLKNLQYDDSTLLDAQNGERQDYTGIIHGLVDHDELDYAQEISERKPATSTRGNRVVARVPSNIWRFITTFLSPCDAASLAISSKTLRRKVGSKPFRALEGSRDDKVTFLMFLDGYLPHHIFCFFCCSFHIRTQEGQERLKGPTSFNPLFNCPNASRPQGQLKTRLTQDRTLSYTFIQLVLRAHRYTIDYGITVESLSRRWQVGEWTHISRYCIYNGHVLMRIASSCFALPGLPPSSERLLLYSREDYSPQFSVCAHWRDGILMDLSKCALSHVPKPRAEGGAVGLGYKVRDRLNGQPLQLAAPVSLCERCRPMRRCPECPTEQLIELKLVEDKIDRCFKQALVVTRWCDLGDGQSPFHGEWAACNGADVKYDSFARIKKRTISGIFESQFTEDHIPGQRILSLNPKKQKRTEEGHGWY